MSTQILLFSLLCFTIFIFYVHGFRPRRECRLSEPCRQKVHVHEWVTGRTTEDERELCTCPHSNCPSDWSRHGFIVSGYFETSKLKVTRHFMFCQLTTKMVACDPSEAALRLSLDNRKLKAWDLVCSCPHSTPLLLNISYVFDEVLVEYYICDGTKPVCDDVSPCVDMYNKKVISYPCTCTPPLRCGSLSHSPTALTQQAFCQVL